MNYTGKVLNSSSSGVAILADSTLAAQSDPNLRDGWYFKKETAGTDKFNIYYWSEGNKTRTTSELTTLKAVVSIDNYQSGASLPYFSVYTKPKGDGTDAQPWYHARRNYTFTSSQDIELGQRIEIFAKENPQKKEGLRHLQFNNISDNGSFSENDEILYIVFSIGSTAPANTQILIESLGITWNRNNDVYLELLASSSEVSPP
tara:strand:+ start:809 stop:1417 length:609 start_codon:yes stop_codon:yes gene_type:complete